MSDKYVKQRQQFDFWVGKWDATWGEDGQGVNIVEKILDGMVILENFDGRPSIDLAGKSVSMWNVEKSKWAQTWVDNKGNYLDFAGGWDDEKERMVLVRDGIVDGQSVRQRMIWHNIAANTFDWNWEQSKDDGETWQVLWQIRYERQT